MGFIKEWQDKLGVKIVCSQVRDAHQIGQPTLFPHPLPPSTDPNPCACGPHRATPLPVLLLCCAQEKEPMGTAGPLALARDLLDDGSGKPFFVLNRCGGHVCVGAAPWLLCLPSRRGGASACATQAGSPPAPLHKLCYLAACSAHPD